MQISNLQSIINKEGVSRSTHYYVHIALPAVMRSTNDVNTQNLGTLCQRIQIPGRIINTTPHMIYGVERKIPFGIQYQDVMATFICTDTFSVRKFFDEWHAAINNPFDNSFEYYNNYVTDIAIMKVDVRNQQVALYVLQEAYPTMISAQQLGYDESDYTTLEVTLTYRRWATLMDYKRNDMPIPEFEIKQLQGNINPELSFPPAQANIAEVAGQILAIAAPVSLTFTAATQLVQRYNNFIQGALNISRTGGVLGNLDQLLGFASRLFS